MSNAKKDESDISQVQVGLIVRMQGYVQRFMEAHESLKFAKERLKEFPAPSLIQGTTSTAPVDWDRHLCLESIRAHRGAMKWNLQCLQELVKSDLEGFLAILQKTTNDSHNG